MERLSCCSDPFLKSKVTELSIASDSNMYSFAPGQAPKAMEVFTTLGHVESIWTVLKNQNNYGPAQTIHKHQASLAAQQAALIKEQELAAFNGAIQAAVKLEMQKLGQDRSASSTTGNQRL